MLVRVNVLAQSVPLGTVPKSWTTTGGGALSRREAMSARKNLLAHGGADDGWATAGPARATRTRGVSAVRIKWVIPHASCRPGSREGPWGIDTAARRGPPDGPGGS